MPAHFETLLASTLFLLSRQRERLSTDLQQRITEHIAMLLQQPEMERYPQLEQHCMLLFGQWRDSLENPCEIKQLAQSAAVPELH